jgi:hypothetical protein
MALLAIAVLAFLCQATANTGRHLQQDPVSNEDRKLLRECPCYSSNTFKITPKRPIL